MIFNFNKDLCILYSLEEEGGAYMIGHSQKGLCILYSVKEKEGGAYMVGYL